MENYSTAKKSRFSWLITVRTVAWAMMGLRGSKEHSDDEKNLNPIKIVFVGLLVLILFVLFLMIVVNSVV